MAIHGLTALQKRFAAIKDTRMMLGQIGLLAVREAAIIAPHKTGNLRRSIRLGTVTDKTAQVIAGGAGGVGYARHVEFGTGLYGPRHARIKPVTAKALRWFGGPAGSMRLSGTPRSGKAGAGAGAIFARSVAGRRATPFLLPGAKRAISKAGLSSTVVTAWNEAS